MQASWEYQNQADWVSAVQAGWWDWFPPEVPEPLLQIDCWTITKTTQKATWGMPPRKFGWSCRGEGPTRSEGAGLSDLHPSLFQRLLLLPGIVQLGPSFCLTLVLARVREGKPGRVGEQLCHLWDDLARELDNQEVDTILKDHGTKAFEEAREAFLLMWGVWQSMTS